MSNKAISEISVFQDDMSVRAEKGDVMPLWGFAVSIIVSGDARRLGKMVVSRVMRKIDFGIW